MGIDAQMFVRHSNDPLTAQEVRRLSVDLCNAFGASRFMIYKPRPGPPHVTPRHALEIIEEYHQDGPAIPPEPGEQFIEVHLWTRFYGPGYGRGDLPFILALADWLRARIPDSEIWYGGDSSGIEAQVLDEDHRDKLWTHFVDRGDTWGKNWPIGDDGRARPTCDFCTVAMDSCGGGPNVIFYRCSGCGDEWELNKTTHELLRRVSPWEKDEYRGSEEKIAPPPENGVHYFAAGRNQVYFGAGGVLVIDDTRKNKIEIEPEDDEQIAVAIDAWMQELKKGGR